MRNLFVKILICCLLVISVFAAEQESVFDLPSAESPPTYEENNIPDYNDGFENGADPPTGGGNLPDEDGFYYDTQPQYNQENGPRLRNLENPIYINQNNRYQLVALGKGTRIDTDPDQYYEEAGLTLFPDYTYITNATYTKMDDVELWDYKHTNLYADGSYAGHKFREIKHGDKLRAINVDEAKYNTKDWIAKKANYVEAEETKKL